VFYITVDGRNPAPLTSSFCSSPRAPFLILGLFEDVFARGANNQNPAPPMILLLNTEKGERGSTSNVHVVHLVATGAGFLPSTD
jgi:hypothetical protein